MSVADTANPARAALPALDRLGLLIVLIAAAGSALPFVVFRANRIVPGEGLMIPAALGAVPAVLLGLVLLAGISAAVLRVNALAKLIAGFVVLAALFVLIGQAASVQMPPGNTFVRVAPGAGFWLLAFAFALMVTDALTRLRFGPWQRIGILALVGVALTSLLWTGTWSDLSILKEYANRAPAFWAEARTHLILAFGSVAAAIIAGLPLGVLLYRVKPMRAAVLNTLNIVQTIPSIALFGLLIAPLAWIAANVPGAAAIGISGIGMAPALVALFAYSLLPIVSNTVVGLLNVPEAANDAARGMGMTDGQRLASVELPLAFPVILTGIRIVLVQNIGLATIAALIGGGGFGVFVFQGIGQTAMDLVLLGAVPTVALAFAAAVILDAFVEMVSTRERAQ